MTISTDTRVAQLRSLFSENEIDGFYVPTDDPHLSEYVPEHYRRREFISGFDGSAGVALILRDMALLWVDGRYFLQAELQVDSTWTIMRIGTKGVVGPEEWILKNAASARIGVDATTIGVATADRFQRLGVKLSFTPNLVDQVWGDRRPPTSAAPAFVHPESLAGESWESKVERVRAAVVEAGCSAVLLTAADEVCWLLNIRASDTPFCPVLNAFALVSLETVHLFAPLEKIIPIADKLMGVTVHAYSEIVHFLTETSATSFSKIWLDPAFCNVALHRAIQCETKLERTPVNMMKAIKNPNEIAGLRDAHVKDAAALISYFAWLEDAIAKDQDYNECTAADVLENFRKKQDGFVGLSFETISSVGPNAAIIHYGPKPETAAKIVKDQIYLCDSGGQYLNGTTDTTRTIAFSPQPDFVRECYTRVLLGHVALARYVFPEGTNGAQLDVIARMPLWQAGLDYRHGTGHGVGAFLNVHEGPHLIATRNVASTQVPFVPGFIVSDEPGYYEDGAFGIRIENVAVCVEADTKHNFGGKRFFRLEQLTVVPYAVDLIEPSLMTRDDIDWVDAYHAKVRSIVGPLVADDALATAWLQRNTVPLRELWKSKGLSW